MQHLKEVSVRFCLELPHLGLIEPHLSLLTPRSLCISRKGNVGRLNCPSIRSELILVDNGYSPDEVMPQIAEVANLDGR